jgi:hypothetical protein
MLRFLVVEVNAGRVCFGFSRVVLSFFWARIISELLPKKSIKAKKVVHIFQAIATLTDHKVLLLC